MTQTSQQSIETLHVLHLPLLYVTTLPHALVRVDDFHRRHPDAGVGDFLAYPHFDRPTIALGGVGLARIIPIIVFSLIGGAMADGVNAGNAVYHP